MKNTEQFDEDFITNLLVEAGFSQEEDNFQELREDLEPLLMDKILEKVFEALSVKQREEIMSLFDNGKEAEALAKIEKMIPDYDNFLADIFQEFEEEYLKSVKQNNTNNKHKTQYIFTKSFLLQLKGKTIYFNRYKYYWAREGGLNQIEVIISF